MIPETFDLLVTPIEVHHLQLIVFANGKHDDDAVLLQPNSSCDFQIYEIA